VELLLEAGRKAMADPILPARHFLISGGTPGPRDYAYLHDTYLALIEGLRPAPVDIMMAPLPELFDLEALDAAGLQQISVNVEVWDAQLAKRLMPEKEQKGRTFYLDFLARAVKALGAGRVRSILLVGLEPIEQTLAGVAELARIGCIPVLSPFRPDPSTVLAHHPAPTAEMLIQVYLESAEIVSRMGGHLGPSCIPCSHNTMTLAGGSSFYSHMPLLQL
jgi:hypothetical protein